MNRSEARAREEERRKVSTRTELLPSSYVETDVKTLKKLVGKIPYDKEDVRKCAEALLIQRGLEPEQQLGIATIPAELDEFLSKLLPSTQKPVFIVDGSITNHWVLLCLVLDEGNKIKVLYKDSCGDSMPKDVQDRVKAKIPGAECLINTQGVYQEFASGPLCLRNLKLIIEDPVNAIDLFSGPLSSIEDIQNYKPKVVIFLTMELAKDKEFKQALKELVNSIPKDMFSGVLEYKKVVQEELQKDDENIDYGRIEEAKKRCMDPEKINEIKKKVKLNEQTGEYEMDIQNKFSEQIGKLSAIFQILIDSVADNKRLTTVMEIGKILEVNIDSIIQFYGSKSSKEDEKKSEELKPDDIEDIVKGLPKMNETPQEECTSLQELLGDIRTGTDQEGSPQSQTTIEVVKKLELNYNKVKEKYEAWKGAELETIHDWALKMRQQRLAASDDAICETIAVMDRAFNLITAGFRLRDTQILSVLIFVTRRDEDERKKGRLCQIHTGEGKTNIVSFLAVIKVLQGSKVDVITSNPVLAEEGVQETKDFYSAFGLTVSTNNQDGDGEFKIGYTADVLYGTISNFQFDYLKDVFEGFNITRGRGFDQVILDEVDSMLVDQGGHIAKLASPFPGMEYLRYIYIKIWVELQKAEQSLMEENQRKIDEIKSMNLDDAETRKKLEEFVQEITQSERDKIKDKIREAKPTDIPLIPPHLKEYVDRKMDVWLRNAVYAKYECNEHEQYRIIVNEDEEKVIAPVDYLNTGVTLKNTIWSDGLHQFIQLKHNLQLTSETLTSSFISNIGYINKYQSEKICGLTGTLGSTAEQELLSSIYNVDYARIPTYKKKIFQEESGSVFHDDLWDVQLTLSILQKVEEKRGVLVICETEKDLQEIATDLEALRDGKGRIRIYANEESADQTKEKVRIGDVILATNIAGRGTDFKTDKDLEANGGLHVCVAFLPCNQRVEEQAFGRTSRQGNKGSAQLAIRQSEVVGLGLSENFEDFGQIKKLRNEAETTRLLQIQGELVPELNLKDQLFTSFATKHKMEKMKSDQAHRYIVLDLKERWALWLDKKDFKGKDLKGVDIASKASEEYKNFERQEVEDCINKNVFRNPYYCIPLAEYYMGCDRDEEARAVLEKAVATNRRLPGAHMKLFDIAITDGHQVMQYFKKALAETLFIKIKAVEGYKVEAHACLVAADESVMQEIDYIQETYDISSVDFQNILCVDSVSNSFLKHLYSRLHLLQSHQGNIGDLKEQVHLTTTNGVDFNGKANWSDLSTSASLSEITKHTTDFERNELQSAGLDLVYSLKTIQDVPETVLRTAVGEIAGGLTVLGFGICFPLFFAPSAEFAENLIIEGIMDILMDLLQRDNPEFDEAAFKKQKLEFIGMSLLTFGLGALEQCPIVVSKMLNACRRLSSSLRNSERLLGLGEKIAKALTSIEEKLEIMLKAGLEAEKFENWTTKDLLSRVIKEVAGKMMDKVEGKIESVAKDNVKALMHAALQNYIQEGVDSFKTHLAQKIRTTKGLEDKLVRTPTDQIDKAVEDFAKTADYIKWIDTAASQLSKKVKEQNAAVNALFLYKKPILEAVEITLYTKNFASYLERNLAGGSSNNNLDEIIKKTCDTAGDQLTVMIMQCLDDTIDPDLKLLEDMMGKFGIKKMTASNFLKQKRGSILMKASK